LPNVRIGLTRSRGARPDLVLALAIDREATRLSSRAYMQGERAPLVAGASRATVEWRFHISVTKLLADSPDTIGGEQGAFRRL
jgi:hypothetical protein